MEMAGISLASLAGTLLNVLCGDAWIKEMVLFVLELQAGYGSKDWNPFQLLCKEESGGFVQQGEERKRAMESKLSLEGGGLFEVCWGEGSCLCIVLSVWLQASERCQSSQEQETLDG